MSYDDIVAAFIDPPAGMASPIAPPSLPATPARCLRDSVEPIATQGWWSRAAAGRVQALGLGFFDGYVWGRAAALGTPSAATVVATFGVFEPGLLSSVYTHGAAIASRDDVLAAREAGATESLAVIITPSTAESVAAPLLAALERVDGLGRPLFAALRELPVPATPHGRLWRATELVREHRGDGHLASLVSTGLDVVTINVLTEVWLGYAAGEYTSTRGFGPVAVADASSALVERGWLADGRLTPEGLRVRLGIEHATDQSQQQFLNALGSQVDDLIEHCEAISAKVVAARSFPHDPRKRAAG
ncbi:MAG: hypothetical protein WD023_06545 [Ilumatobacteraceae bacterium]